jgi:hypothetical protein
MIKIIGKHVMIINHELYASSYVMIITRIRLYSSSYALLYERYENLNKEELFIVGFIPNVFFLQRRQALQVALALLTNY